MFNAQPVRSRRFHKVSDEAASSDATSVVWMQATANGSQVFVALSTVVVLLVGIGFSSELRPDVRRPDRVHRDGPDECSVPRSG